MGHVTSSQRTISRTVSTAPPSGTKGLHPTGARSNLRQLSRAWSQVRSPPQTTNRSPLDLVRQANAAYEKRFGLIGHPVFGGLVAVVQVDLGVFASGEAFDDALIVDIP